MKQLPIYVLWFISLLFLFTSCDRETKKPTEVTKTIFVYMPWSNNLTEYFYQNISDLKTAVYQELTQDQRLIVYLSTTSTDATLFEIRKKGNDCQYEILKEYVNHEFTTVNGLSSILHDVQSFSPALNYSMIIGCHGMGWIPVDNVKSRIGESDKLHWEYEGVPLTRYFGGTQPKFQTDISTLAEAIMRANLKMEYILFDDCYMANIEVAYELKEVTDYLIASTCEIMAYGMPYSIIGGSLFGKTNYKAICDGFYSFYSNYERMPCGTLSVIDCSQLNDLAQIMREINDKYVFDESLLNSLQRLDGYTPVLFFDYGDYVNKLCDDTSLKNEFQQQLEKVVPHKVHTDYYYSMSRGKVLINNFSGITISDPSIHSYASQKNNTSWYRATH